MSNIIEQAKTVPILDEVDACVLGGGVTGVFAAVRAARLGARVALVERQNCFGGAATSGLVNIWHSFRDFTHSQQIIGGLSAEVIERLKQRDAVLEREGVMAAFHLNTEELKIELDQLVSESNVVPHLHTMYAGPYVVDGRLRGVFVQNKSGRGVILAKVFVDASGDGDLCWDLGFASYTGTALQPPTMCCKIQGLGNIPRAVFLRAMQVHSAQYGLPEDWGWSGPIPNTNDVFFHAENHLFDVNCSKAEDLTKSEMEGRRLVRGMMDIVREQIPDAPPITLLSLASVVGIRETRRFGSLYQLTADDVLTGCRFADAIANGTYPVDVHHSDGAGITFRYLDGSERIWHNREDRVEGRWREPLAEDPPYYQIPFRALVPKDTENVIMCGRMIDADHGAFGAIRVMVNLNQTGEAAGAAAYLAVQENQNIPDINPVSLRKTLADGGSIIL